MNDIGILASPSPKLYYYGTVLNSARARDRAKITHALIYAGSLYKLYDQSRAVMPLLERLAPEQQAEVLAGSSTVRDIVWRYGNQDRVLALIGSVTPEQQAEIFKANGAIDCFVNLSEKDPAKPHSTSQIMTMIENLPADLQAAVLAAPEVVSRLVWKQQKDRVLAIIQKLGPEQQAAILKVGGAISCFCDGNSRKRKRFERTSQIMTMIENMPDDIRLSVLAAPDVLYDLGWRESRRVVRLIEGLPLEQQTAVLMQSKTVLRLATKEHNPRVAAVVRKLPTENQCAILSVPENVYWIVAYTSGVTIMSVIKKLAPDQQASILMADRTVQSLGEHGHGKQAIKLISKLTPDQQVAALTAKFSLSRLTSHFDDLMGLIEKLPYAQQGVVLTALTKEPYFQPSDEQKERIAKAQEEVDLNAGFYERVNACEGSKYKAATQLFLIVARKSVGHRVVYDPRTSELVVPISMFDAELNSSAGCEYLTPKVPDLKSVRAMLAETISRFNVPKTFMPKVVGARAHYDWSIPHTL